MPLHGKRPLSCALDREGLDQTVRRRRFDTQALAETLDALVARMVDRDPIRRPALPLTVARALEPFCR